MTAEREVRIIGEQPGQAMGEAWVVELLGDDEQRDCDALTGTVPPTGEAIERGRQPVTHLVGTHSPAGPRSPRVPSDLRVMAEVIGVHGQPYEPPTGLGRVDRTAHRGFFGGGEREPREQERDVLALLAGHLHHAIPRTLAAALPAGADRSGGQHPSLVVRIDGHLDRERATLAAGQPLERTVDRAGCHASPGLIGAHPVTEVPSPIAGARAAIEGDQTEEPL